jgi:hypothetical protein
MLDAKHVGCSDAETFQRCERTSTSPLTGKAVTGELGDATTGKRKNAAAVALGRLGGKARAKGLSAKRRQEIATGAANKRWQKER